MDFSKAISYEDFKNNDYDEPDEEMISRWQKRNFYSQMMDVWGEVDKTVERFNRTHKVDDDLIKKCEFIHKIISVVRNCPGVNIDRKITLRIAEWELYDYMLWGNSWDNTEESIMNWFDQWCYEINYDLLD